MWLDAATIRSLNLMEVEVHKEYSETATKFYLGFEIQRKGTVSSEIRQPWEEGWYERGCRLLGKA